MRALVDSHVTRRQPLGGTVLERALTFRREEIVHLEVAAHAGIGQVAHGRPILLVTVGLVLEGPVVRRHFGAGAQHALAVQWLLGVEDEGVLPMGAVVGRHVPVGLPARRGDHAGHDECADANVVGVVIQPAQLQRRKPPSNRSTSMLSALGAAPLEDTLPGSRGSGVGKVSCWP